jgi:hypothetical protein
MTVNYSALFMLDLRQVGATDEVREVSQSRVSESPMPGEHSDCE